jgi:hypothetical protein
MRRDPLSGPLPLPSLNANRVSPRSVVLAGGCSQDQGLAGQPRQAFDTQRDSWALNDSRWGLISKYAGAALPAFSLTRKRSEVQIL